MSEPQRIQLRRTKGWRKPDGAVVVARPSRWGNPYRVGDWVEDPCNAYNPAARTYGPTLPWWLSAGRRTIPGSDHSPSWVAHVYQVETPAQAVDLYRRLCEIEGYNMSSLRGRDLACWCPLDAPCHADVLLELANRELS